MCRGAGQGYEARTPVLHKVDKRLLLARNVWAVEKLTSIERWQQYFEIRRDRKGGKEREEQRSMFRPFPGKV